MQERIAKGLHVSLWELICTPLSCRYYVSQWYFIPSPLSNLCLWGETGMWAKDENLKVCFHLRWEDHMMWSSVLLDCSSTYQWFFLLLLSKLVSVLGRLILPKHPFMSLEYSHVIRNILYEMFEGFRCSAAAVINHLWSCTELFLPMFASRCPVCVRTSSPLWTSP